MAERLKIYLGEDTLLECGAEKPMTAVLSGTVVTPANYAGATVKGEIYDEEDLDTQLGADITLSHQSTDGHWAGTIADTHADLVENMEVEIKITAAVDTGLMALRHIPGIVVRDK
jgi:hypothetical protein